LRTRFEPVLESRREPVLADPADDLVGGRPVVDTAGRRELRVDAQLHVEACPGGIGTDTIEDRPHCSVQVTQRLVEACLIQAASPLAVNACPSGRKMSPVLIALAGTEPCGGQP